MTPPSHILIGLIAANTAHLGAGLAGRKLPYLALLTGLTIGSVMPDFDYVSHLWDGYFTADIWTGHRGITHSILGTAVMAAIFGLILTLWDLIRGRSLSTGFKLYFGGLFAGGVLHIVADLPGPDGLWDGIPVFFPVMKDGEFARSGGWNLIGWYDLEVIYRLLLAAGGSTGLLILAKIRPFPASFKRIVAVAGILVSIFGAVWVGDYIRTSEYRGYSDEQAKQRQILATKPDWYKSFFLYGIRFYRNVF